MPPSRIEKKARKVSRRRNERAALALVPAGRRRSVAGARLSLDRHQDLADAESVTALEDLLHEPPESVAAS